jgi:arabinogalactan endo-1,4-beta-galactosidase
VDGDIREYMKISLSCTVNISRATPKWFHNNKEIKENNERITMLSTDCEYKLIIHHVEFADEGEYMVVFDRMTSKKSITVKGISFYPLLF